MEWIKRNKKDVIYISVIAVLVIALTVVGVLWIADKGKKSNLSYYDMKCEAFRVQNTNLEEGQVVFIGDSITDLCVLDRFYADIPFAVYNRGIGGDTTGGVLKRLQVSLYDIKPSRVVLMIGTNDVNGKIENGEILDTYRRIVEEIRKNLPDTKLYCMSIIPQNLQLEEYTEINVAESLEKIIALNPEIKKIAEENGAKYLDLFPLLADNNNRLIEKYSDDGIHLNDAGFAVWTSLIKPELVKK